MEGLTPNVACRLGDRVVFTAAHVGVAGPSISVEMPHSLKYSHRKDMFVENKCSTCSLANPLRK